MALLISITLVGNGVAHAAVVVPPGGSGHACTGYSYVQLNPNLYWQTCAWADGDTVWFTVHLGNVSSSTWYPQVDLRPIRSGEVYSCPGSPAYVGVLPHSTTEFPYPRCGWTRFSAAYASRAYVRYNNYYHGMTSPTLQVQ